MKYWFYVEDGLQQGPVDEAGFQELARTGRITPDTLVWTDGMPDWLTYAEAAAASGTAPPQPAGQAPTASPPGPAPAPLPTRWPPEAQIPDSDAIHPLAITGLILGLASIPFFCCCSGIPFSVPGAIVSAIALVQSNRLNSRSRVFAIIGLTASFISLGLSLLPLFVGLVPQRILPLPR